MLWCASAGGEAPGKHAVATSPPKSCPVEGESCVTCHMPKVELRGAHFKFTDHRIRITRPETDAPTRRTSRLRKNHELLTRLDGDGWINDSGSVP